MYRKAEVFNFFMVAEVWKPVIFSRDILRGYPISDILQMRYAGFNWVGYRFAGVFYNLYYDRECGFYRISVGASLKLRVSLSLNDLVRYHVNTPDMSFGVKVDFFFGESLYLLDVCFGFVVEWVFHFGVTVVSYIVAGLSDSAFFNSLRLIEGFFLKNWSNRSLDSFAIRGRFAPFADSEFFYVRFFCGILDGFVLKFFALTRLQARDSVMRLWVVRCLLFLEDIVLGVSKLGLARSAVKGLGRLYFLGGRRVLGSLLVYSRFRKFSVHFLSDVYFLDIVLASLRNYYSLLSAEKYPEYTVV